MTVSVKRGFANSSLFAPGTPVPVMTGKTTDGTEVAIDSTKNVVLVHFYSAWDDCEQEVAWLADFEKKYGKEKLTIIGVGSVASADYKAWDAYLAKLGATWKSVPDPDGAIAKNFGGCALDPIGSHATGCIMYVLRGGRIVGGDVLAYDYGTKLEHTCTGDAIAKIFP